MGKMQGKKDKSGYDIDLNVMEELAKKTDYWASAYQFIQKMQFKKKELFTEKEKQWLCNIELNHGAEYDRLF